MISLQSLSTINIPPLDSERLQDPTFKMLNYPQISILSAFHLVQVLDQEAVQNVYSWVHRDEDRSRARLEELGLPAPLAAPDLSDIPLLQDVEAAGVLLDEAGKEAADEAISIEAPVALSVQSEPLPVRIAEWGTYLKPQRVQVDLD